MLSLLITYYANGVVQSMTALAKTVQKRDYGRPLHHQTRFIETQTNYRDVR